MALKNVEYRPGDVIITKHGAMMNTLGHSAMVIDSEHVLNITGPGNTPHPVTISKFIKDSSDNWIKLYRANDYYEGAEAAKWIDKTYRNSGAKYVLSENLNSTDSTYCTKMIFQAYHFGNGGKPFGLYNGPSGLIAPFDLIRLIEKFGHSMAFMGYLVD